MIVAKLCAVLFVLLVLVGIQVATLMLGWGLTPRSWAWILGLGVLGNAAAKLLLDLVVREIK